MAVQPTRSNGGGYFPAVLIVLIWWIMVLVGVVPIGHALIRVLLGREVSTTVDVPFVHVFFAGLFAATVWAMTWSLFASVGAVPYALWMAVAIALAYTGRTGLRSYLVARLSALRQLHYGALAGVIALFVVGLIGSVSPSELYDEGGYFLPYIKWLEHHGAVRGIAHIDDRFGFNSAIHATSALFSLWWSAGEGLYDLNGLVLIVVAAWFMGGASDMLRGRPLRLSAVLKVFSLFFLLRNMITGPRSDLPAMLIAELALVLAAAKVESQGPPEDDLSFRLLVLYSVFLVGIKFTSVLIALVPLYFVYSMVRHRVRVPFITLTALTAVFLVPWMVMNVVVSGYLIYPLYRIDVFQVDWKVPEPVARRQYFYVSEFAKSNASPADSERLHGTRTLREWVPLWFERENAVNRSVAVALLVCTIGLIPWTILRVRKYGDKDRDLIVFVSILVVNDLVWFFRSPAFRFGWATIIGLIACAAFLFLHRWREGRVLRYAALAVLAATTLQSLTKSLLSAGSGLDDLLLWPAPTERVTYREVDLHGLLVREADGFQCWGTAPPCFHHGFDRHITPRGDRVQDGFRWQESP